MFDRVIESRTYYPPPTDLYEDWELDRDLTREAQRLCRTAKDFTVFVREWNAKAKRIGSYVRIRSVEED